MQGSLQGSAPHTLAEAPWSACLPEYSDLCPGRAKERDCAVSTSCRVFPPIWRRWNSGPARLHMATRAQTSPPPQCHCQVSRMEWALTSQEASLSVISGGKPGPTPDARRCWRNPEKERKVKTLQSTQNPPSLWRPRQQHVNAAPPNRLLHECSLPHEPGGVLLGFDMVASKGLLKDSPQSVKKPQALGCWDPAPVSHKTTWSEPHCRREPRLPSCS